MAGAGEKSLSLLQMYLLVAKCERCFSEFQEVHPPKNQHRNRTCRLGKGNASTSQQSVGSMFVFGGVPLFRKFGG